MPIQWRCAICRRAPADRPGDLKDIDANGAVSLADLGLTNANLTRVLPVP